MSLHFKIVQYEVELDLNVFMIEPLVDIIRQDASETKSIAKRVLKAVYLLADEESPCDGMDEKDRWEFVVYNCDLTEEVLQGYKPLLDEAVAAYILINTTSIKRSIDVLDKTIDATAHMLSATQPVIEELTKRKNVGSKEEPEWEEYTVFQSNAPKIQEYAETLNKLIEQRDELYAKYVKKKAAGELRSGKAAGALSSGKLKNPVLSGRFTR